MPTDIFYLPKGGYRELRAQLRAAFGGFGLESLRLGCLACRGSGSRSLGFHRVVALQFF